MDRTKLSDLEQEQSIFDKISSGSDSYDTDVESIGKRREKDIIQKLRIELAEARRKLSSDNKSKQGEDN